MKKKNYIGPNLGAIYDNPLIERWGQFHRKLVSISNMIYLILKNYTLGTRFQTILNRPATHWAPLFLYFIFNKYYIY